MRYVDFYTFVLVIGTFLYFIFKKPAQRSLKQIIALESIYLLISCACLLVGLSIDMDWYDPNNNRVDLGLSLVVYGTGQIIRLTVWSIKTLLKKASD